MRSLAATRTGGQTPAWIAMARLVRRTGFGAAGADVDAALALGPAAYVATVLAADSGQDPGALATPLPSFAPVAAVGANASAAERKARNQQRREQLLDLTGWWLRRMVTVAHPFPEKLTFCWHDHFATAATKVRSATLLAGQHNLLRTAGRGDFRDLAQGVLVDPAMLFWLDGQKNTVNGANENLAREFMELFALGQGVAYTEADVKDGARALTGWRITAAGVAQFTPRLHDPTIKTVLGVTGQLDQADFGDAVLAQAGSARHVATRLYGQLVSDTPPAAAVVDRLVGAYGPARDLTGLLRALLTDPSFAAAADSIVINPVEWLVGALRALRVPVTTDAAVRQYLSVLRALGQVPFYPPNVSGWPSGQAWLSTAAADIRVRTAAILVRTADLSAIESASATERIDAVGHLLGIGAWSARSVAALSAATAQPPQLVAIALNTPEYLVH